MSRVKQTKRAKKRLAVMGLVFISLVVLSVASIFKDWLQIMDNKQQITSLNQKYNNLLSEEESLTSEVTKLHDASYVARYARERYMYSLPGELIIELPN